MQEEANLQEVLHEVLGLLTGPGDPEVGAEKAYELSSTLSPDQLEQACGMLKMMAIGLYALRGRKLAALGGDGDSVIDPADFGMPTGSGSATEGDPEAEALVRMAIEANKREPKFRPGVLEAIQRRAKQGDFPWSQAVVMITVGLAYSALLVGPDDNGPVADDDLPIIDMNQFGFAA